MRDSSVAVTHIISRELWCEKKIFYLQKLVVYIVCFPREMLYTVLSSIPSKESSLTRLVLRACLGEEGNVIGLPYRWNHNRIDQSVTSARSLHDLASG